MTRRHDDELIDRLAGKLLIAEVRFADATRDVSALDARADGVAETVAAVFNAATTPWAFRVAARSAITHAGPRPDAWAGPAVADWWAKARAEVIDYLIEVNEARTGEQRRPCPDCGTLADDDGYCVDVGCDLCGKAVIE